MQRTRQATHHRGWDARQMSADKVARDIVHSMRQKQASGMLVDVRQYTGRQEVIEKVEALLAA